MGAEVGGLDRWTIAPSPMRIRWRGAANGPDRGCEPGAEQPPTNGPVPAAGTEVVLDDEDEEEPRAAAICAGMIPPGPVIAEAGSPLAVGMAVAVAVAVAMAMVGMAVRTAGSADVSIGIGMAMGMGTATGKTGARPIAMLLAMMRRSSLLVLLPPLLLLLLALSILPPALQGPADTPVPAPRRTALAGEGMCDRTAGGTAPVMGGSSPGRVVGV
jgi:hypothetical protein